jgi:Flp pilus assembly protein TadB
MANVVLLSITYWVAISMCIASFGLFWYMVVKEFKRRTQGSLEGMPNVGDMAERFSRAGPAPSALACSVLFLVLSMMLASAIEGRKLNPFF